jgi:hypothetical protein
VIGPSFSAAEIPDVIERLVSTFVRYRENEERFVDTVQRIGLEPFKEQVYGANRMINLLKLEQGVVRIVRMILGVGARWGPSSGPLILPLASCVPGQAVWLGPSDEVEQLQPWLATCR